MVDKEKKGKEIPSRIRGIEVSIKGDCIDEIKDVAFLEMPDFLVEDDGRRAPFLRVVTEKGSYRIKLEKI